MISKSIYVCSLLGKLVNRQHDPSIWSGKFRRFLSTVFRQSLFRVLDKDGSGVIAYTDICDDTGIRGAGGQNECLGHSHQGWRRFQHFWVGQPSAIFARVETRAPKVGDSVKHFQECLVLRCTLSMQGLWGVLGLKFRKFRDRWDRSFSVGCWEHPDPKKWQTLKEVPPKKRTAGSADSTTCTDSLWKKRRAWIGFEGFDWQSFLTKAW